MQHHEAYLYVYDEGMKGYCPICGRNVLLPWDEKGRAGTPVNPCSHYAGPVSGTKVEFVGDLLHSAATA